MSILATVQSDGRLESNVCPAPARPRSLGSGLCLLLCSFVVVLVASRAITGDRVSSGPQTRDPLSQARNLLCHSTSCLLYACMLTCRFPLMLTVLVCITHSCLPSHLLPSTVATHSHTHPLIHSSTHPLTLWWQNRFLPTGHWRRHPTHIRHKSASSVV